MNEAERVEHQPWPMRPFILLGLGALAGLCVYLLLDIGDHDQVTRNSLRLGSAAFLVVGGIAFALTLERLRWTWSAAFAAAAGFAVALVTCSNGDPELWTSNQGWRFAASLLSVAIAVPLFQAVRDSGSRRLEPGFALDHAWTDVILWCLSCAFLLAVWLLLVLLGGLFGLIGIDAVKQLILKPWFMLMLAGGTLGMIVGLLRDRDSVITLLHRVARTILSVLAPLLGIGLVLFVIALAFTGLEPLWRETEATTPILLACILAALLLTNAVIGNAEEEEPKVRIIAWGAMALGAAMLPLAIVAAISMSKRIGQYGFSPDRLWAAIVVTVAVAVSAAYLFALVRGRLNWAPLLRRTNVLIVAGIAILALLLALPILDFAAVSARDQVARLEAGRIAPDKFDWSAMRFDFGPTGVRAVEQLARSSDPRLSGPARRFLAMKDRWQAAESEGGDAHLAAAPTEILVRPTGATVPPELRALILPRPGKDAGACGGPGDCLLFWKPGDREAIVLLDGCSERAVGKGNQARPGVPCTIKPSVIQRGKDGRWSVTLSGVEHWEGDVNVGPEIGAARERAMLEAQRAAIERGDIEIREIKRRRIYIGGKPEGDPFD